MIHNARYLVSGKLPDIRPKNQISGQITGYLLDIWPEAGIRHYKSARYPISDQKSMWLNPIIYVCNLTILYLEDYLLHLHML